MDIDILKPDSGFLSIERPSVTSSSKGTSDRHSSDSGTPDADIVPSSYTEPVSDGEDEEMDIAPAKDEGRRMGLTETEAAEAIAYREKMLKETAQDQILNAKHGKSKAKGADEGDEYVLDDGATDMNGRKPFLWVQPPATNAPERPKVLSIDPLAPSSAFDETLRERLQGAKSLGEGESSIADTAANEDQEADREEGSSRGGTRGDDRDLVRHFKAPSGKRVAVPVRIEPKVYFAAERTFLVSFLLESSYNILLILSR